MGWARFGCGMYVLVCQPVLWIPASQRVVRIPKTLVLPGNLWEEQNAGSHQTY